MPIPSINARTPGRGERAGAGLRQTAAWTIRVAVIALALIGSFASGPAQAQRTGAITGRVLSEGRAVAGAEVGIVGASLLVTTSDSGTFTLRPVPSGQVTLFVRAIGFAQALLRLTVAEDGDTDQIVELRRAAQPLPDVRSEARFAKPGRLAHTTKYDDFYRRRRSGLGSFLTRDDIERASAIRSFELLRGLPGIRVAWNPPGVPGTRVRFTRCDVFPPRVSVWIDGNKQVFTAPAAPPGAGSGGLLDGASSAAIDPVLRWQADTWREWLELFDAVRPGDIEAMEIFRGVAQIPAEFLDDSCAAVAIWTRDGSPR